MNKINVFPRAIAATLVLASVACSKAQRADVDSAAGDVSNAVRDKLSVIDIDMGRHLDANDVKKIGDKTDDFAPTDTIFASVHTSGTANNGAVVAHWTYQDSTTVGDMTDTVTTNGGDYSTFFLTKPKPGLAKGKYTLHILIDGKEVRTKDVEVK